MPLPHAGTVLKMLQVILQERLTCVWLRFGMLACVRVCVFVWEGVNPPRNPYLVLVCFSFIQQPVCSRLPLLSRCPVSSLLSYSFTLKLITTCVQMGKLPGDTSSKH